jgi:oxalate---CoA ligase
MGIRGEKIAPVEVDAVMLSHKDIEEVVCFGVPDDLYGQEIHAAVILKSNAHISEKQLQEYIGKHLAKFKVPKKVFSHPPAPGHTHTHGEAFTFASSFCWLHVCWG